ncbi:hypothetical protein HK103_005304 [Boothiomyces macroporosus]|uniref:Uncharacterized protein n=1 Tax=Boothiomyces macroporosus TaxID=261099 RepID=A0AAD5UI61_9FUNG|nr:hypothetical protein HK103_005304 [Boothiomyces macroporosus]
MDGSVDRPRKVKQVSEKALHSRRLSLIEGVNTGDTFKNIASKKLSASNLIEQNEGKEQALTGKLGVSDNNGSENELGGGFRVTGIDGGLPKKDNKSVASSVFNTNRFLKELHEPISLKFRVCFTVFWSIGWQILLIILYGYLNRGLIFPSDSNLSQLVVNVVVFFGKIAGIYFAHSSVTLCVSIYFAIRLTSPEGYSIIPCIYVRQHTLKKITMVKSLTLNSPCRSALQNINKLYIFLDFMNLLALFVNMGIYTDSMRTQAAPVNCIIYKPQPSTLDRNFPTLNYAMGVAKTSFSASIGYMRADLPIGNQGNSSKFVMIPSLIDAAQDHQVIIGYGHSMNVSSQCICASTVNSPVFNQLSYLNNTVFDSMTSRVTAISPSQGMVNYVSNYGDYIQLTTFLAGYNICGEDLSISPLCITTVFNYYLSVINVEIVTDGTSASLAPIGATIESNISPGSLADIEPALSSILGGTLSSNLLPKESSGKINPLLKWSTVDLQQISFGRISSGMEVLVSYLIRTGIQRTFRPFGTKCPTTLVNESQTTMYLSDSSTIIGYVMSAVLVILGVLQFYVVGLWLARKDPILPALRLFQEKQYFVVMVNSSAVVEEIDDLCNAENYRIWQAADKKLRMGEDLATVSDPDSGTITLGKPKLIHPFKSGRNYQ